MNNSEFERFKSALSDIRADLKSLKSKAKTLIDTIDADRLAPTELADSLSDALQTYCEKSALLQKTGAELSISFSEKLEDLDTAVAQIEDEQKRASEMSLIFDYFRLTAQAESVRADLEATKQLLKEKCALTPETRAEGLAPYRLVVEKVSAEGSELDSDEFDFIEKRISKEIARAVDRHDLVLNSDADISSYLDGSCELLNGPKGTSAKENAGTRSETEKKEEDKQAVADTDDRQKDDKTEPAADAEPIFESFAGYAEHVIFEVGANPPASSLGASKFSSLVKQKPDVPMALFMVGNQKLLAAEDEMDAEGNFYAPSQELRSYLTNHGFFTNIEIEYNGERKTYLSLTSKAWACYTKADTKKILNSRKPMLLILPALRSDITDCSPKIALATMAIHEHFSKQQPKKNYTLFPETCSGFVYAKENCSAGTASWVCVAAYEKGKEKEDIDAQREFIEKKRDTDQFVIIVFAKEDIRKLASVLSLSVENDKCVTYCLFQNPSVHFNSNGELVEIPDSEGSNVNHAGEDGKIGGRHADDSSNNEIESIVEVQAGKSKNEDVIGNDGKTITGENDFSNADTSVAEDSEENESSTVKIPPKELSKAPSNYLSDCSEDLLARAIDGSVAPDDKSLYRLILSILRGESSQRYRKFSPITQALLLARSAAGLDKHEKCEKLYKQLLLATNSPLDERVYSSEILASVFDTVEYDFEGLKLSAYLFSMLLPAAAWDFGLKFETEKLRNTYDAEFSSLSCVKPVFSKMLEIRDLLPGGFTKAVISRLGNEAENDKFVHELSMSAKALMIVSMPKTRMKALPQLYSNCFGKSSDLYKCIEIVADKRTADKELVELILEDFCTLKDGIYSISDQKISEYLDQKWYSVNGKDSSFSLDFAARQQATRQMTNRVKLIKAWYEQTSDFVSGQAQISQLKSFRSSLVKMIQEAEHSLEEIGSTNALLLIWALQNIAEYLSGDTVTMASMFDELAISGVISLDEERLPLLEPTMNSVQYFEPWRRVLHHITSSVGSFAEAKEEILSGGESSDLFDNLRQLEIIGQISGEPLETSPEQLIEATDAANDRTTRFKESLELAYTYDRITETEKENLAAIEEQHQEEFFSRKDFGIWRQLLKALDKRINELSEIRHAELFESLQAQKAKLEKKGTTSTVLAEAERLLEGERNYAVAEEYINRFIGGEVDFSDDLQSALREPDSFAQFIQDNTYLPIYNECFKRKNGNFRMAAVDYLQRHYPKDWTARLKDNSENLAKNWPIRRGNTSPAQIQNLFTGFGLQVNRVAPATGKKEDMFRMDLIPTAKSMADYRHPISAFGTQTKSPMNVVVLYGNVPPKQLVDLITAMGMGGMTIVLLNFPISLAVRRQIAEEFHKTSGQNPFILIDQVLFLFLALHQETERLPVLLKCSLPFTTYQPFVRDGGPTADDMFCGRSKELATIKDPNGACVVYGGRQLGKTALLERAESLCMKPENRAYAVYCTIAKCTSEAEMAAKVVEETKKRTGIDLGRCATIKALSDAFESLFRSRKMETMLLLLDETDIFLDSIANDDYAQLQPLIDLRRATKNNFKFVLAGLHNVCRAKNATARNGVFGQLGTPLCIKPLSPTDALQLLSRPLKYLGFQIDRYPHLETILTNTNYYPGILQFFGYMLVETLTTQYSKYYQAVDKNPPFTLQDEQLGAVMNSADLNTSIKDKFRWSLELDPRYFMIARCIALLYYLSDKASNSWQGFTIEEIMEVASGYGIICLSGENQQEYKNLLDEMEEMGILSKPDPSKDQYRLRRSSFINIIGSNFDIVDADIRRDNT